MEDTSVLEVPSRDVPCRKGTVQVTPLTVVQIPRFLRVVRPMLGSFKSLLPSKEPAKGAEPAGFELDILELLEVHGERVIEALAIAISKPVEWFVDVLPDDFGQLIKAVVEVNQDFFAKRVAPLLGNLAVAPRAEESSPPSGAGPTVSST